MNSQRLIQGGEEEQVPTQPPVRRSNREKPPVDYNRERRPVDYIGRELVNLSIHHEPTNFKEASYKFTRERAVESSDGQGNGVAQSSQGLEADYLATRKDEFRIVTIRSMYLQVQDRRGQLLHISVYMWMTLFQLERVRQELLK